MMTGLPTRSCRPDVTLASRGVHYTPGFCLPMDSLRIVPTLNNPPSRNRVPPGVAFVSASLWYALGVVGAGQSPVGRA